MMFIQNIIYYIQRFDFLIVQFNKFSKVIIRCFCILYSNKSLFIFISKITNYKRA